ncbi:MAG: tail fiber domain-containing protein [Ferruginibacter sp.]
MKKYFLVSLFLTAVIIQSRSQNVGIGTTNPTLGKLEVQAPGTSNTVAIFGGDGQGISIQRSNPCIGFNQYFDGIASRYIANGYAAAQTLNAATGDMYFDLYGYGTSNNMVNSTTRAITISKNGSVGIGVAPLAGVRLSVGRGTGSNGTAVFRGSSWASHINYNTAEDTYIRGGKNGSYVYLNDVPGGEVIMGNALATATSLVKVGINSINPSFALQLKQFNNRGLVLVDGSYNNWQLKVGPNLAPGSYQLLYYNEGANAIGAYHPQTGAYAALSDERLKTDIVPLPDVSSQLSQLQPVQYLIDRPGLEPTQQAGFIAQDLIKVLPGLVMHQQETTHGELIPDMHLVNYEGLAVYAIKLIQEQQQKIETLKKRLEALKQKKEKTNQP